MSLFTFGIRLNLPWITPKLAKPITVKLFFTWEGCSATASPTWVFTPENKLTSGLNNFLSKCLSPFTEKIQMIQMELNKESYWTYKGDFLGLFFGSFRWSKSRIIRMIKHVNHFQPESLSTSLSVYFFKDFSSSLWDYQ